MAAPLDIDCFSCRATARCACRKGDGTPTEPHAVRVALSVACDVETCKARVGKICTGAPGTALYHPERMYKAKGITGPAFKVGLQRHLEALVTFLQSCPTEVASAHLSVEVRGEANLPRLFGEKGRLVVVFRQGGIYASARVAEPERRTPPRRPDPRPTRATGLHQVDLRRARRAPESYEDIAEEMEDQCDPPDDETDEDDDARALPPGPPAPAPLLLGPSSLAAPVPAPLQLGPSPLAAPQPLALPPPGQQSLFLLPGRTGKR